MVRGEEARDVAMEEEKKMTRGRRARTDSRWLRYRLREKGGKSLEPPRGFSPFLPDWGWFWHCTTPRRHAEFKLLVDLGPRHTQGIII